MAVEKDEDGFLIGASRAILVQTAVNKFADLIGALRFLRGTLPGTIYDEALEILASTSYPFDVVRVMEALDELDEALQGKDWA